MEAGTGQCVRITFTQPVNPPYVPPTPPSGNCGENEVFVFNQCVCSQGYTRNPEGRCILNIVCPDNSFLQNGVCTCNTGYVKPVSYTHLDVYKRQLHFQLALALVLVSI